MMPDDPKAPWPGILVNGYKLSPDARFVPWPLPPAPKFGGQSTTAQTQGLVGDPRFATRGDKVIPRTNRATTKKWAKLKG